MPFDEDELDPENPVAEIPEDEDELALPDEDGDEIEDDDDLDPKKLSDQGFGIEEDEV
jgi:hypothetical protein